jgi:two-component sensor histidine kinase
VPLALILNELVTNAAKYGTDREGRGTVRVALAGAEGRFTLVVEDDGPGFDLSEVRRRSSGLGLVMGLAADRRRLPGRAARRRALRPRIFRPGGRLACSPVFGRSPKPC